MHSTDRNWSSTKIDKTVNRWFESQNRSQLAPFAWVYFEAKLLMSTTHTHTRHSTQPSFLASRLTTVCKLTASSVSNVQDIVRGHVFNTRNEAATLVHPKSNLHTFDDEQTCGANRESNSEHEVVGRWCENNSQQRGKDASRPLGMMCWCVSQTFSQHDRGPTPGPINGHGFPTKPPSLPPASDVNWIKK